MLGSPGLALALAVLMKKDGKDAGLCASSPSAARGKRAQWSRCTSETPSSKPRSSILLVGCPLRMRGWKPRWVFCVW